MTKNGVTRRQLGVAALAAPVLAQNTPPAAARPIEVEQTREGLRGVGQELRKFRISTLLEPSFVFRP